MSFKTILAFLALYLGWGSTYLAIDVALEHFPPFKLAGIRFFLAGLIFFLWCLLRGIKIPPVKEVLKICFAGFLLLFLGSGSVTWVEQYLSTGLTSIVWASLPIWLVAMDKKKWKYHLSNFKLLSGLLIGFFGVVVLFWDREMIDISKDGTLPAFLIAMCGVVCFSFGSLYSKYVSFKGNTILIVAIQMMFVGALAMIVSLSIGEKFPSNSNNELLESILALTYLIVIGSLVAYFAYVWLLNVLPTTIVGTYTYINPAVAILLGWWFLGESVTSEKTFALMLIFIGVIIVNFYKSKTQRL